MPDPIPFDERLDLLIEREVAATPAQIWRAWTEPDLLKQWFAPKPVTVTECEIDPRPGGIFRTVMLLPDGSEMRGDPGCILEAIPERRIVFTDGLQPGWRPGKEPFMTAVIDIAASDTGARYRAHVLHSTDTARIRHEEMGFKGGWNSCIDQLADLAASLKGA